MTIRTNSLATGAMSFIVSALSFIKHWWPLLFRSNLRAHGPKYYLRGYELAVVSLRVEKVFGLG
jgi:hypothetical protein